MTNRTTVVLVFSTCIAACTARTTSLGGPEDTKLGLTPTDNETGDASSTVPAGDSSTGDSSTPSRITTVCHGYSWDPVPTTVACEFFLPSGPPPNGDPRLDPQTWNPHKVRIVTNDKTLGPYVASVDDCNGLDGWYYSDAPEDGGTPTRFKVCPKTCASYEASAFIRLDAETYCEYVEATR